MEQEALASFLAQHPERKRIAISGGADGLEGTTAVDMFLASILKRLPLGKIMLITGGTRGGVPGVASAVGAHFGVPVIGIVPQRVRTEDLVSDLTHTAVVSPHYGGSEWGDESELFVKLADAIIFFGGKWGSAIEFTHAMKINTGRVRRGEQPIYLIPVLSFLGIPQALWMQAHMSVELMSACFPDAPLSSPDAVAAFLQKKWWT